LTKVLKYGIICSDELQISSPCLLISKFCDLYPLKNIGGNSVTSEKSCGAIVYRRRHGNIELLLIKHVNSGHWSFPKGHVEPHESEAETAIREIKEETGLDVILDTSFREIVTYFPKKETRKNVIYFLAKAKSFDFVKQDAEIEEIKWVDMGNVPSVLTYENDKSIAEKAKKMITI
jgi:ADP-ribose pyrophosphatase YjhB (NUDIX family)